jgi:hypothetical protein
VRLVLLRLLEGQRALYEVPRDMARFRAYIAQLTANDHEMAYFLAGMNPMAKDKAAAAYDALLAMHAEDLAEAALRDASARLAHVTGDLKVALLVQDDAQGAWSQPEPAEAQRWRSDAAAKKGYAPVALLSSRCPYAAEEVRAGVLAGVYRAAHMQRHGPPRTLRDVLVQEGRTMRFAGIEAPAIDAGRARKVIAPHLDVRSDFPETFATMFGDALAVKWGRPALGLPERAGFAVALSDADAGPAPETLL